MQYWRGRFSSLCDRLRSEDNFTNSPGHVFTGLSQRTRARCKPQIDHSDSFEVDDIRRSLRAINELRSCCRTADALGSFEDFAQEINAKYEQESAVRLQAPSYNHSTDSDSKARVLAADFSPDMLGTDKNIAAATMNMMNTQPMPSMTRSKTTGDMLQTRNLASSSTSGKAAKVGWRRPSYLKAQQEVLVNETTLSAERRARAVAAAQRNARRSGTMGAVSGSPQGNMLPPATKLAARHSLPRKSSGSNVGTGTSAEMFKKVFSESVRSVRRMGRSFTGMSGTGDM